MLRSIPNVSLIKVRHYQHYHLWSKSELYCYAYVHSPKPNSPWEQLDMINLAERTFLKFSNKFSKSTFLYFSLGCIFQILTPLLSSSNGFSLISHQKVLPFLGFTVEKCIIDFSNWEWTLGTKGTSLIYMKKSEVLPEGSSACLTAF